MYYQINQPQYPPHMTAPMEAELTTNGFESLKSADAVAETLEKEDGTVFVLVNSVCGCSARNARPAAIHSTRDGKKPDKLVTVFAGVDGEAVSKAREYFLPYPPSSPSMALFKNGELVYFVERRSIEGNDAVTIARALKSAFEEHC